MVELAGRAVIAIKSQARVHTIHHLAGGAAIGIKSQASTASSVKLAGRAVIAIQAKENPLGPGYGLTVGSPARGGGSGPGAGFDELPDPTVDLGEGDEFRALLPGHGVSGMIGLSRLLARSASDEDRRQRLDTVQFIPDDDQTHIPRLAGGDQVRVRIPASTEHSLRRFQRRVNRERRRR